MPMEICTDCTGKKSYGVMYAASATNHFHISHQVRWFRRVQRADDSRRQPHDAAADGASDFARRAASRPRLSVGVAPPINERARREINGNKE